MEYDEEKTITAVVTQGRSTHDEYLRSFNVLYKKSGSKKLKFVLDEHGNPKVSWLNLVESFFLELKQINLVL